MFGKAKINIIKFQYVSITANKFKRYMSTRILSKTTTNYKISAQDESVGAKSNVCPLKKDLKCFPEISSPKNNLTKTKVRTHSMLQQGLVKWHNFKSE